MGRRDAGDVSNDDRKDAGPERDQDKDAQVENRGDAGRESAASGLRPGLPRPPTGLPAELRPPR